MKKNALTLAIIFCLAITAVSAFAEDVKVSVPNVGTINAGKTTVVNMDIMNSGSSGRFSISVIGMPSSWISVDPWSTTIASGDTASVSVYISPDKEATPGSYSFNIYIKKDDGTTTTDSLLFTVVQSSNAIVKDLKMSCYECRNEKLNVTFSVFNVGVADVPFKLKMTMNGTTVEKDVDTLASMTSREYSQVFDVSDFSPGVYNLDIAILSETRNLVSERTETITVPKIHNITAKPVLNENIFGRFFSNTITNNGNVPDTAEVSGDVLNQWYSVYSGPEPMTVAGSKYSWSIPLAVGETIHLNYSEIFWTTPVLLLILGLIGLYMYFYLTLIRIRKRVSSKIYEANKQILVTIDISNMLRSMDNIIVKDIVPNNFKVVGKFETIVPVMRKIDSGVELVWRIGKLNRSEERILHYRIVPISEVYDEYRMPRAALKGKLGDKIVERMSDHVTLFAKRKHTRTEKVKVSS